MHRIAGDTAGVIGADFKTGDFVEEETLWGLPCKTTPRSITNCSPDGAAVIADGKQRIVNKCHVSVEPGGKTGGSQTHSRIP